MHCYHFGIEPGWQIPTQHDEHANLYLSFVTSPFYYLFRYMLACTTVVHQNHRYVELLLHFQLQSIFFLMRPCTIGAVVA